jgi:membrane-bound lytic murein transglycosylase A
VRPRPADLVVAAGGEVLRVKPDGTAEPYPDRAAIETAAETAPLAWMRPEELFFLQVQGSGVLVFEDGRRQKALYAAHNGRPFAGIANPMRDRGLLARDNTSGDAIRAWLAGHRGPEADAVMRLNPRYAFFRLAPDDGKPPQGAAGLPLPAGRAVAVDPGFHPYGELLWIDGEAPLLAGAFPTYRRLVSALDTGGAIRGEVRADLYLGQGEAAGAEAGRVRHTLSMWRLVPR